MTEPMSILFRPRAEVRAGVEDIDLVLEVETAPAGERRFTQYRLSLPAARRLLRELERGIAELSR